jgi:transcriptional regulator with XRE-family HTH domain
MTDLSLHSDPAVDEEYAGRPGPSHIGPRLRARRELLGLSLRELARRIGVSASLISQIERDKVNPSVSTLYSLVRELGLGMGELFSTDGTPEAEASPAPTSREAPRVTPESRSVINLASGVTWERLTSEGDPLLEFLRVVYEPGSESCPGDSLIRHAGREYGYVLSGRLGVQISFDRYELGAGDSISFDSSAPHRLWTIGDQPAEAIWVVVGRQPEMRVGPL